MPAIKKRRTPRRARRRRFTGEFTGVTAKEVDRRTRRSQRMQRRRLSVKPDIARLQRRRKVFGGAMTAAEAKVMKMRRRAGSPLARKNLKTLFKSALGTFPAKRHRMR